MAFVLEGKPFLLAGNDSAVAVSFPAASGPGVAVEPMGPAGGSPATLPLSTSRAATEASVALMLLMRGFLPMAGSDRGTRWIAAVMIGFVGISVVHFLVE